MTAPRKPARTGAAPQGSQAAFLVSLRQTGNVSAAARAAGTCRSRCYEARQRDRGSYSAKNAKRLGARDGEEYDLGTAMDANTDDTITKIIAGAAIVSIISGLFFGVLQPLLAPPTFTGDDGTVYMKSADGSFVEK